MRAARVTDTGLALCDVAEPAGELPGYDVVASSICGTDFELVARGVQGFTLGHEMAVTADGVVYAVEPTVRCGVCEQCRAGFTQRCTGEHGNLGIFSDGGLADRVAVPPYALVPLPMGLDPLDACLVEPAAVAWHAVRRAEVGSSERVAVVGGGSIGLLVAAWLRSLGHSVDLEARHPHQRAIARDFGAGPTEDLYDVVIDAAGGASSLGRCAELAIPGGRIIVLGVYFESLPVPGALDAHQGADVRGRHGLRGARRRPRVRGGGTTPGDPPRGPPVARDPPLPPVRSRRGLPGRRRPGVGRGQGGHHPMKTPPLIRST